MTFYLLFIIFQSFSNISIMASNQPDLEKLYERLTIEEEQEEDSGIIVGAADNRKRKRALCLWVDF